MEDNNINFLEYKMEYYYGQPIDHSDKRIKYLLSLPFPLDEEQIKTVLMVIKEMWHTYTPAVKSYEITVIRSDGDF